MARTTTTLEANDITVTIGQARILDGAHLQLHTGKVTAIIGPNGAGKSTLLSVAAGHGNPSSGSVTINGHDLLAMSARKAARLRAVMPQNSTVAFPFTVADVVAMGRTAWGRTPVDDAIVADVIERNDLTELAHREITTLSGGERQRVAFARVIAQASPVDDRVILLDEPTAAMDIAHAEITLGLLRKLAAQGAAIGVVLHDLDAAAAYADELLLLHRGRVVAVGPVREVCDAEVLSEVYGTSIEVFETGGRLRVGPVRRVAHH